ncbi:receptor homology region, transmembrane domain- and RING domain-containing protein 2-like [Impatiens glandulifera]|uniref:receptor homology region, transmembrane domain- and RING domain-containing protein 2-like n=1 Tax=Impatiens glandulifera TaxID=253017 RepID=UPI001FB08BCB|nr:receptor homology region, transmembrane domain- and RING domain-containing protein 2-like [Impatiens glandulifera]
MKVMISLLLFCFLSLTSAQVAFGNVVIIGPNVTRTFEDYEAIFAPSVKGSGEYGKLYLAEPLDACSNLTNKVNGTGKDTLLSFALIVRGVCSFEGKVRKAQQAGFKAAIIFDNVDGDLVAMAGNSAGIKIRAMFISKVSGEILVKYAGGDRNLKVWIVPNFENSAWSIMAISFISLLAMSAVLATCFFVRRHRIRRQRPLRASQVREFHGMSSHLVKAMPSLIFTSVLDDRCTSMTCAICLEDYTVGEKLRILPCRHKFHASCVDKWLTTWRTFCPVCKRDARTSSWDPPPSERTPLLSSGPVSIPSSSSSSFRSSLVSTPSIQIYPVLQIHSASPIPHSSYRSLASPHSSVVYSPSLSSLNSRYLSPPSYYPSSVGLHSSYIPSSNRRHNNNALHYSGSAASFSPYDSAQSLPGF